MAFCSDLASTVTVNTLVPRIWEPTEVTVIQLAGAPSNNATTATSPQSGTGFSKFCVFLSSLKLNEDYSPTKSCTVAGMASGFKTVVMQPLIRFI